MSGAALGAALAIVLLAPLGSHLQSLLGLGLLPCSPFSAEPPHHHPRLSAGYPGRGTSVTVMLLAGVAITALSGAVIGLLTYLADDQMLRNLSLWQMGSLAAGKPVDVTLALLTLAALLLLFMRDANPSTPCCWEKEKHGIWGERADTEASPHPAHRCRCRRGGGRGGHDRLCRPGGSPSGTAAGRSQPCPPVAAVCPVGAGLLLGPTCWHAPCSLRPSCPSASSPPCWVPLLHLALGQEPPNPVTGDRHLARIPLPLLSCRGLRLSRGNRLILDSLDLDLHAGSLTALLGPNGAGKSSLLKCLTGELEHEGEIHLFGQTRRGWAGNALAHRVGVLPQSSSLSFPFLCEEVVAMGRLPHSEPASRRDEIVRAAMTHAGVDHLANRLYPGLSGGERQRVQFARVLAQIWQAPEEPQQARLLLLDEPTSALDLKYQHQLLAMARALAGRNTAVLVVLHDLNLAARYADRLVMLEQGRLMADGSAGEVLTPALIARLYDYPAQVIHHPESGVPMVV